MLKPSLCDYNDAYMLVKGTMTVVAQEQIAQQLQQIEIMNKNCAPFSGCISKINNIQIDNAEDLDIMMPMYNLLEYSNNYAKTSASYGIIVEMNQTTT